MHTLPAHCRMMAQRPGTKGVKIDISEFVMELICICTTSVINSVGNLSTLKLLVQEYHRNLQGRCTSQRKSIKKVIHIMGNANQLVCMHHITQ